MKSKKLPKQKPSSRAAKLFFLIFSLVILFSFFVKLVIVYKNSIFDGHRLTIAVVEEGRTKIISFAPQTNSVSLLNVNSSLNASEVSRIMRIPVQAVVIDESSDIDVSNLPISMVKLLITQKLSKSGLTFFDILRMSFFAQQLPPAAFYQNNLSINSEDIKKDSMALSLFSDTEISSEKKRIQIINSTDYSGLGNRLASALTNIGANVVLVTSEEKVSEKSKILSTLEDGYTVKKIGKVLGLPIEKPGKDIGIADIVIILGRDAISSSKF